MNKQKLAAIMIQYGDTQETLARILGISRSRLNAKINQYKGAEFSQAEIAQIQKRYGLAGDELQTIFFEGRL